MHDARGRPAYWLVPVQLQGSIVGAMRVLGNGQVAASIAYRSGSGLLALERAKVLEQARQAIAEHGGEYTGDVLLIHDGPPGREAWRVDVLRDGRLVRWIFVIPGGIYERAPGGVRGEGGSSS